jgi:hypothetical protein
MRIAVAAAWWVDHHRLTERAARQKMDRQISRAVDGID